MEIKFSGIVIDLAKIRDYALNPEHPRGKHKARVFESALGIKREHTEWLAAFLKTFVEANMHKLTSSLVDQCGRRF